MTNPRLTAATIALAALTITACGPDAEQLDDAPVGVIRP